MDLKLMSILMCTWLCVVIFIMVEIGVFSNDNFVAFGPRKELSFMKVSIDTWIAWNFILLCCLYFYPRLYFSNEVFSKT